MKVRELIEVLKALPQDVEAMLHDEDGNLIGIDFAESHRMETLHFCECGHYKNLHAFTPAVGYWIIEELLEECSECPCKKFKRGYTDIVRIR